MQIIKAVASQALQPIRNDMLSFTSFDNFDHFISGMNEWIFVTLLNRENLYLLLGQIAILLVAWCIKLIPGKKFKNAVKERRQLLPNIRFKTAEIFLDTLIGLIPLLAGLFFIFICLQTDKYLGVNLILLELAVNLATAWAVIKLAASVIPDRFWARAVAFIAWIVAVLNIIGILDETVSLLETAGLNIGEARLSIFSIIKIIILVIVLLKAAKHATAFIDRKLSDIDEFTPSTRLMLSKIINITMIVLVVIVALNTAGLDLTALAVFSGAVGVGVGFGLQKVVGNFISGLILLSDKSIKPNDVIEMAGVYGWVKYMGGRYVSVVTRDNKEYLIPNEDLITRQVINWSYSSNMIRVRVPFGVSYDADPHQVIKLVPEAVGKLKRILPDREPRCLLTGFGDSSVDFELRFWINDPQEGVGNVISQAYLKIWDILKANGISIPFPQRDLHIVSSPDNHVLHPEKPIKFLFS